MHQEVKPKKKEAKKEAKKEPPKKKKEESSDDESEDEEVKEAKAKERFERKLYKPTGPDGQGWGDFRQMTDQEKIILDELLKIERAEEKRREKLIMLD